MQTPRYKILIEDDPKIPGGRIMRGIEGMIFRSLAERMNFTIKMVERKDKDRGEILPDGNYTGILKMVSCFIYFRFDNTKLNNYLNINFFH